MEETFPMTQNLEGLKVAILVAEGFEQVELTEPKKALESAGAQTSIVSPVKAHVQGWNHFEKGDRLPVDVPLGEADSRNFDALSRQAQDQNACRPAFSDFHTKTPVLS
jgi:protease I